MKRIFIPGIALMFLVAFTACDDNKEPPSEQFSDSVATLIIPAEADAPASAMNVQYTFLYNYGSKTMDFGINGLKYKDVAYKFLGSQIPASTTDYFNGKIQKFNVVSISNVEGGAAASNVNAIVSTMLNFRPAEMVQMMPVKRQYQIEYSIPEAFTARTFDSDAYYFGNTGTSYVYNNEHKEFTSDKPVYNVKLDFASGTATVCIYNPVFAAEMPPSMASTMMQLDGLRVEYTHDSYRICGENIVPKVREGALMVPNPHFTFNNFTFSALASDLRAADINFKVADKYDAIAGVTSALDRNNKMH